MSLKMSSTGINDRLAKFKAFSVVTQILLINAVLFLICNVSYHLFNFYLEGYLIMPSNPHQLLYRFYTPITYMFMHHDVGHIFFNMIYFYFMGEIFSSIVGPQRLWFVYILGGLVGAVFFLLFFNIFSLGSYPLLGASAAVIAVSVVAAIYAPNMPVSVFFIGSFPLKWVVLVLFLLSTIIDLSANTGGKVAHLGGAVFGLLYGMQLKKGNDLMSFFKRKPKVKSKNLKVVYKTQAEIEEKTLDEILDKINKSGYESLSKQEKETLQKIASKK